jgi:hypothetical protein
MKSLFVAAVLLLSFSAGAQAPGSTRAQQLAAMEKIAWMAGIWEGASTIDRGAQGNAENFSWERVRRAAGGTALLIEGRHHRRLADGSRGDIVHDAAALITFDPAAGRYRFVSQLADGSYGNHEAQIDGEAFVWRVQSPRGVARFRITLEQSRWTERGEFCPTAEKGDPPPCRPFFSMSLGRVGDAHD